MILTVAVSLDANKHTFVADCVQSLPQCGIVG